MKPFFKPFFGTSMTSRVGQIIGKGLERVMLASVGGGNVIRKAFRTNADGSVTMLSTRAGMPEFTTAPSASQLAIVVGDASDTTIGGTVYLIHIVTIPRSFGSAQSYTFSIVDTSPPDGHTIDPLTDDDFSDGVTISGGEITVPAGVTSFSITVTVTLVSFDVTYEVHVGSGVGYGVVTGF